MPRYYCAILLILLAALSAMTGCSATRSNISAIPTLPDSLFPDYAQHYVETKQEIFAIDDAMIAFVEQNTAHKSTEKKQLVALITAIFDRKSLALSYKAHANTVARDTFSEGTANCMSLTIMTYVMTQHLGMQTAFQDIAIPEFWTRKEGNTLINKHINLIVKPRRLQRYLLSSASITVDFDPQQGMQGFRADELTKSELVSNFYTNKAADHLINDEPSRAYAYLKAALTENVNNEGAWLNLGVLLSQQQHYPQAALAYNRAIALKADFTSAYENLALLYKRKGEVKKADALLSRLHKKRQSNPFYHKMLGDVAAETDDYDLAISHYKRAISLDHKPHAFHFSLAKVYFRQGDVKNAHRYLEKAKRRATDINTSEQYALKIANLVAKL